MAASRPMQATEDDNDDDQVSVATTMGVPGVMKPQQQQQQQQQQQKKRRQVTFASEPHYYLFSVDEQHFHTNMDDKHNNNNDRSSSGDQEAATAATDLNKVFARLNAKKDIKKGIDDADADAESGVSKLFLRQILMFAGPDVLTASPLVCRRWFHDSRKYSLCFQQDLLFQMAHKMAQGLSATITEKLSFALYDCLRMDHPAAYLVKFYKKEGGPNPRDFAVCAGSYAEGCVGIESLLSDTDRMNFRTKITQACQGNNVPSLVAEWALVSQTNYNGIQSVRSNNIDESTFQSSLGSTTLEGAFLSESDTHDGAVANDNAIDDAKDDEESVRSHCPSSVGLVNDRGSPHSRTSALTETSGERAAVNTAARAKGRLEHQLSRLDVKDAKDDNSND